MSGTAPTELGTKPIGALLKQYAVPGIIAMTASSLYNMVDSIYIGHIPDVGSLSIAGLAVTFPLMNISTAFGTLVGVGAATMISVLLGQKNYDTANKVLCNDVTLNVITGAVFTLVTLLWMDPILRFFGASDATLPFARGYMTIIAIGNAITHLYFGLNSIVRSSGNPGLAMRLTLFTVISNAILDPVFIFALGMGVQGAAIATVLCQLLALIYTLRYFSRETTVVHFGKSVFEFHWKMAKSSLAIGMGPFLMNSAACLVNLFINQQLLRFGGDLAIGAYSIVSRFSFLFIMIVMGINQGMQPIAGYNYGARKYRRVRKVYFLAAGWATAACALGFIMSEFFPRAASGIFTSDPTMLDMSAHGLRMANWAFLLIGMQIVSTNLFQCLGMVRKSIFLSLTRQLLFLIPLVFLLPKWFGITGVWYSFPLSDLLSFSITGIMILSLMRKFKNLEDGADPSVLGGYKG